jgi:hypothetical protein
MSSLFQHTSSQPIISFVDLLRQLHPRRCDNITDHDTFGGQERLIDPTKAFQELSCLFANAVWATTGPLLEFRDLRRALDAGYLP